MILAAMAGLVFSAILLMASLWQLEIITGWDPDDVYDFPFYWCKLSKWVARDLWYAINLLAWVLAVISGIYLGLII